MAPVGKGATRCCSSTRVRTGVLSPVRLTNHSLKKGQPFAGCPVFKTLALADFLAREKFLVNAGGCVGKHD